MNWTFGICTDGQQDERLVRIIDSIVAGTTPHPQPLSPNEAERVAPKAEVLICGNSGIDPDTFLLPVRVLPFDEGQKPGWITRKKNLLCQAAAFEPVCLLHDYFTIAPNWGESFRQFGMEWDVCVPIVQMQNGRRLWVWETCDHAKVMRWDDTDK